MFLGTFLGKRRVVNMQKKNYKGRCEKRSLSKCKVWHIWIFGIGSMKMSIKKNATIEKKICKIS